MSDLDRAKELLESARAISDQRAQRILALEAQLVEAKEECGHANAAAGIHADEHRKARRDLTAALKVLRSTDSDVQGADLVTACHVVIGDKKSAESGRDFYMRDLAATAQRLQIQKDITGLFDKALAAARERETKLREALKKVEYFHVHGGECSNCTRFNEHADECPFAALAAPAEPETKCDLCKRKVAHDTTPICDPWPPADQTQGGPENGQSIAEQLVDTLNIPFLGKRKPFMPPPLRPLSWREKLKSLSPQGAREDFERLDDDPPEPQAEKNVACAQCVDALKAAGWLSPDEAGELRLERHKWASEIADWYSAYDKQRARADKAEGFISSMGYRRCDIPACNCGQWHGSKGSGGWVRAERLKEIADLIQRYHANPNVHRASVLLNGLLRDAGVDNG